MPARLGGRGDTAQVGPEVAQCPGRAVLRGRDVSPPAPVRPPRVWTEVSDGSALPVVGTSLGLVGRDRGAPGSNPGGEEREEPRVRESGTTPNLTWGLFRFGRHGCYHWSVPVSQRRLR